MRFICENFVPHFVAERGCSESQVYIWWDFMSVSQTDHVMQKRQIECLPIFVAMSDAVCALRAGDEDFYAKEGAEMYDAMTRSKVPHRHAASHGKQNTSCSGNAAPSLNPTRLLFVLPRLEYSARGEYWKEGVRIMKYRGFLILGIARPRSSTPEC